MVNRSKERVYRETLHELAKTGAGKDQELKRRKLEGKAAKLGLELYGEERKGKPKTTLSVQSKRRTRAKRG